MNVLGEGFPEEIINQVKIRQQKYGSGYSKARTPEEILYLNSRTSWCKLVSSTDISDANILNNSNIKELGYKDDKLARNFILFNGTTPQNSEGKSGINNSDFSLRDKAYTSWGITNADWGFRPMAGITYANIKHKNRGSIRIATVNIKAWDKISFEIIDALYLRLGFSILLEWGNSIYFDNNNTLITEPDNSLADDFLDGKDTYIEFLSKIKHQRIKSNGNYDAMFGKVTNFHWSFQPDGSYDITLDLVSIGDIIESFKVSGNALSLNNIANSNLSSNDINLESRNTFEVIKKYAPTNDIADYLYKIATLFTQPKINYLYNISNDTDFNPLKYWSNFSTFKTDTLTKDACWVRNTPDDPTNKEDFYFIRLGNLLKFIEEGIMYKIKSKKNSKSTPMLSFDYSINDNLMHVPPQLMSFDPTICMVRRKVTFPRPSTIDGFNNDLIEEAEYFNFSGVWSDKASDYQELKGTKKTTLKAMGTDFADPFMVDELNEVGKIMNIYVNFKFIISKLQELTDTDTNELKLFSFLKEILSGINSAFGGYSKLDLFIDETTNEVKIIDQNPLPSNKEVLNHINSNKLIKIPTQYAFFELYGYNPTNGSAGFIKDFKFNTELTSDFATMIAVSATSNGNVIGENNTALSKLNLGLKDRFKDEVNGGGALLDENNESILEKLKSNYDIAQNEYNSYIWNNFVNYLNNLYYGKYINNEIQDNKGAYTTYLKLYKKYKKTEQDLNNYLTSTDKTKTITKFQPGTGFIPFNLSLTMDGLSGMKIGSKFLVDGSYLPSNYPSTVDFLIKNITHEIKNNKWDTMLESYCIAQGDDESHVSSNVSSPVINTNKPNPTATVSKSRDRCAIKNIPSEVKIIDKSEINRYFKSKGYSKAAIAGIISNIQSESGLNLNAFNSEGGGCGAYGLAQWRGNRQTNLFNYAKLINQPVDSSNAQLGHLYNEINNEIGSKIKGLTSPNEAAYVIASEFERFKNASQRSNPEVIKRQNLANVIYKQLT